MLVWRCQKGQDRAGAKYRLMTTVVGMDLKLWLLATRTPGEKMQSSKGVYEIH